jgi:hypothetical protein
MSSQKIPFSPGCHTKTLISGVLARWNVTDAGIVGIEAKNWPTPRRIESAIRQTCAPGGESTTPGRQRHSAGGSKRIANAVPSITADGGNVILTLISVIASEKLLHKGLGLSLKAHARSNCALVQSKTFDGILNRSGGLACPGKTTVEAAASGTLTTLSPAANSIFLTQLNSERVSTGRTFSRCGTWKICAKEAA